MAGRTAKRSKPEIKLNSYDDLFGETPVQADAVEVMTRELHDFENHPFHVKDDEDMAELVQSVRDKGILVPLTVRPKDGGGYDITKHPNYRYTSDYDKKYTFDIEKYLNRRMRLRAEDMFEVIQA